MSHFNLCLNSPVRMRLSISLTTFHRKSSQLQSKSFLNPQWSQTSDISSMARYPDISCGSSRQEHPGFGQKHTRLSSRSLPDCQRHCHLIPKISSYSYDRGWGLPCTKARRAIIKQAIASPEKDSNIKNQTGHINLYWSQFNQPIRHKPVIPRRTAIIKIHLNHVFQNLAKRLCVNSRRSIVNGKLIIVAISAMSPMEIFNFT